MSKSAGLCGAAGKRSGEPCKNRSGERTAHEGVGRCWLHGGASPQAQLTGVITLARREAAVMGMPVDIEPHDAILECIRITAGEVAYCSERIAELQPDEAYGRVESTHTRPLKLEKGEESTVTTVTETKHDAPALHIWIVARRQAMDRLVTYSATALKAGVEERQVRVAEGMAEEIRRRFELFAQALGLELSDPKVKTAMRGALTLMPGGLAG